ncbi:acetoacetate--CoA ligase [Desulforhopalus singaporensis]|uniref:Acetoacetyl-CoA synthetase n=1 Tax=Desulforhopalus singaporensis TaxID=91360 RepID=A0A1H0RKI7_9BACT|nr:acetoacetate--CoA ligase [Desulforhopalus singaporensis]SDP30033.1 acetoacetyl-CoA synthetase [Desulforhopalus singaporensis]
MSNPVPLWSPSEDRISKSLLSRFISHVNLVCDASVTDYTTLYQWSLNEKEQFWSAVWQFCGVKGDAGQRLLVNGADIEKAVWFPDAKLNFAENLLSRTDDEVAIYFRAEDRVSSTLSWKELGVQVASLAKWMKARGVKKKDVVAGYLPNIPESVVAMLAATSIGAIWTSTSPDFGVESVVERFSQTSPKILICADGYFYSGKTIDVREKIVAIKDKLPSLEQTVVVDLVGFERNVPGQRWEEILLHNRASEIEFVRVGFNDPVYILYSSGTTGKPKCIAHKVGGVVLQHFKELMLHSDVKPGDKVFYFTTCGWMMWNWLVSALGCRASIVLYDGSPFYPDADVLWDYAQEAGVTLFGTSAKYIDALKKNGLSPGKNHNLQTLKTLCSTGSVLVPESFGYVYEEIKKDLCLASISGGTDIVSCFVLGCPILPVYAGESQCRGLGMAVEVFDEDGNALVGEKGELVCRTTFPSQPACFWGDESGEKYHKAYFARYDNVWHHGDFVRLSTSGGVTIYGRSDATLNPAGVRIGTAEIYRCVEQLEKVQESLAIGQDWDNDVRVVLFVVLRPGVVLDRELEQAIRATVFKNCSPRHVPAKIVQVGELPRTKSGKIVELAVREVVHNRAVKNIGALANPEALRQFENIDRLQH